LSFKNRSIRFEYSTRNKHVIGKKFKYIKHESFDIKITMANNIYVHGQLQIR